MLLLVLLACDADVATLADGRYPYHSIQGDFADADLPGGLALTLSAGTVTIRSDEGDIVEAELDVLPRAEWLTGCPTNFAATDLETALLPAEFSVGALDWSSPLVVAGCGGADAVYLTPVPASGDTAGPCTDGSCMRFELVDAAGDE